MDLYKDEETVNLSTSYGASGKLRNRGVIPAQKVALLDLRNDGTWIFYIVVLVIIWWTAAISVTLLIKSTLSTPGVSAFPYPCLLTSMTNGLCALGANALLRSIHQTSPPKPMFAFSWEDAPLVLLGSIQGAEIGLNNMSLEYLSVSARTMMGSYSVVVTLLTAWLWGLEDIDLFRCLAAAFQVCGGMLQGIHSAKSPQNINASSSFIRGALLQTVVLFLNSNRWVLIQRYTQQKPRPQASVNEAMQKLELMAQIMPWTSVVCFCLAAIFELRDVSIHFIIASGVLYKVVALSVGVGIFTLAELLFVQQTSAMAMQVLSALQQVPVVLSGVALFHDEVDLHTAGGFVLCILGALCYARARAPNTSLADESRKLLVDPDEGFELEGPTSRQH